VSLGKVLSFNIFIFLPQKLRNKTLWVWHVVFFLSFLGSKEVWQICTKDLGSFLSFLFFGLFQVVKVHEKRAIMFLSCCYYHQWINLLFPMACNFDLPTLLFLALDLLLPMTLMQLLQPTKFLSTLLQPTKLLQPTRNASTIERSC